MKRLSVCLSFIFLVFLISCSSFVSSSDKKEMKEIIDKVLSYDISYDDELADYINEENFYTSNYRFFYTLFLGDLSNFEYSSEMLSVNREGKEYRAYLLLNMKAEGEEVHEDEEESEEGEINKASAEGVDVPVEIILKKTDNGFYIKSVTEYNTLDEAKEECEGFQ